MNLLPLMRPNEIAEPTVEQIEFETVAEIERNNGPTDRFGFENIKPYFVAPGDNLEAAIKRHAKIALCTGAVYEISETVKVTGACYIIGNCARIRITKETGGPVFCVTNTDTIPSIAFMERVCFSNIIFECSREAMAVCIVAYRGILVHNCVFSGSHMLCVDVRGPCEVRACQFVGVVCAIRAKTLYSMRVKQCIFEKCIFGTVSEGKLTITNCAFSDCTCSLRMGGMGTVRNCHFVITQKDSPPMTVKLCTCEGSGSHPTVLENIHIASNKKLPWPKFENNVCNRVRLFLGKRTGVFHPRFCVFAVSVIVAMKCVSKKMHMFGVYDSTCVIAQCGSGDNDETMERLCICGDKHQTPMPKMSYVTDVKLDRALNSYDTAEYSSSDDES